MLEGLIKWAAPQWALNREMARQNIQNIQQAARSNANLPSTRYGQSVEGLLARKELELLKRNFYEASRGRPGSYQQNFLEAAGDVPNFENISLRAKARAILRNSTVAKALLNNIVNQMCPINLVPEPGAILDDGTPDAKFNDMARALWHRWGENPLIIGGMSINQAFQQCGREIVTTGEVLNFHHLWETADRLALKLPVGYQIGIRQSEELDNLKNTFGDFQNAEDKDKRIFQGVEVDQLGRRTFYWLRKGNPFHWLNLGDWQSLPYDAKDFTHAYIAESPSQYRGVSWFAPSMDFINQINDLCWNELTSSTQAACTSVVIKRLPQTNMQLPSVNLPHDIPLEERYRQMSWVPGMAWAVNPGEDVEGLHHEHPKTGTDQFCEFLIRLIATPYGVKPSAVHGNFAGSSYSSEASCAIETLPQRRAMNDFFVSHVAQPVYGRLIRQALIEGYFPGRTVKNIETFKLCHADWPQNQVKSINPQNDVAASQALAASNLSNWQDQAQCWGADLTTNLIKNKHVIDKARAIGLPEEYILQMFKVPISPIIVSSSDVPDVPSNK